MPARGAWGSSIGCARSGSPTPWQGGASFSPSLTTCSEQEGNDGRLREQRDVGRALGPVRRDIRAQVLLTKHLKAMVCVRRLASRGPGQGLVHRVLVALVRPHFGDLAVPNPVDDRD